MPGATLPVTHPAHQIAKKRRMQQYVTMQGRRMGAARLEKAEQLHAASRRLLVHGSGSISNAAKRGPLASGIVVGGGSNIVGVGVNPTV